MPRRKGPAGAGRPGVEVEIGDTGDGELVRVRVRSLMELLRRRLDAEGVVMATYEELVALAEAGDRYAERCACRLALDWLTRAPGEPLPAPIAAFLRRRLEAEPGAEPTKGRRGRPGWDDVSPEYWEEAVRLGSAVEAKLRESEQRSPISAPGEVFRRIRCGESTEEFRQEWRRRVEQAVFDVADEETQRKRGGDPQAKADTRTVRRAWDLYRVAIGSRE